MKRSIVFTMVLGALLLVGCKATELMYQVSTVTPLSTCNEVGNKLLFENEEVACWYDFWSLGGNTSVEFQNKSDRHLLVLLPQCAFTLNNVRYPYYDQTREMEAYRKMGRSIKYSNGQEPNPLVAAPIHVGDTLLDTIDPKILYVAPRTTISIPGFVVNNLYMDDTALRAKPKGLKGKSMEFTREEAPFTFSNSIAYLRWGDTTLCRFDNGFFVSQVINLTANELYEKQRPLLESGQYDTSRHVYYCPLATPNHYFVPYNPDDMPRNYSSRGLLFLGAIFLLTSILVVTLNQ